MAVACGRHPAELCLVLWGGWKRSTPGGPRLHWCMVGGLPSEGVIYGGSSGRSACRWGRRQQVSIGIGILLACQFFAVASPQAGGDTVGAVCGGGNLSRGDYAAKIATLVSLNAGIARVLLYSNDYFERTAPSPGKTDAALLAILRAGIEPYVMFEFQRDYDSAAPNMPDRNYRDMLKGLADGAHASDPAGKVIPGGYLALNRDFRKPAPWKNS